MSEQIQTTGDTDGHTETTVIDAEFVAIGSPPTPVNASEPQPVVINRAPAPAQAGQRLKRPKWERFCRLVLQHSPSEAYRRAMGKHSQATKPSTAWERASRLMARPDIQRRIAELRAVAARATALDVAAYAQELRVITQADPTEL